MLREKTLIKIIKAGIYLILILVPLLIWSSYIFPYITTKTLFFRSVVAIMLPFYFYLIYKYPQYRPKKSWLLNFIFIFGGVILITSLLGINVLKSLYGDLERMWGVLTVWHFILFFLMLISVLRTEKDWLKIFKISSITAAIVALYGIAQKFGVSFIIRSGISRIESTLGNAAFVAGYFLLIMGVTLYLLYQYYQENRKINFQYLVYLILQFFAFAFAGIRGAYLAFIITLLLFIITSILMKKSRKTKFIYLGILIILATVYFFLYANRFQPWVNENTYLSRLTSIVNLNSNTVKTRFISWTAGLNGFEKTPLLGVGMENYNIHFDQYVPAKLYTYSRTETWFDRAHNAVVEVLVSNGIFGLISYLGIFVIIYYYLFKIYKKDTQNNFLPAFLLALVILAYFIQNIFVFDTLVVFLIFILFIAYINYLYQKSQLLPNGEGKEISSNKFIAGSLISLSIVFMVYSLVINYTMSKIAYFNALSQNQILKNGDYQGALNSIKKIFSYNSQLDYFNNKSATLLTDALIGNLGPAKGNPQLLESLNITLGKLEKDVSRYPGEVYSLVVLGRSYNFLATNYTSDNNQELANKNLDKAYNYLNQAKELSPGRLQVYYLLAQNKMIINDFDSAKGYLEQAISLNPDFSDSYWFAGINYLNFNYINEGLSYINQALDRGYAPSSVEQATSMINYAVQVKDYQTIIRLYNIVISIDSNNPQYYANLAATYAVVGDIENATFNAYKAAEIDPSFRDEAEEFVRQIEAGEFTLSE